MGQGRRPAWRKAFPRSPKLRPSENRVFDVAAGSVPELALQFRAVEIARLSLDQRFLEIDPQAHRQEQRLAGCGHAEELACWRSAEIAVAHDTLVGGHP